MADRMAEAGAGGQARILIVDDESANLEALRATLAARGYQVSAFTDPTAALDAVAPEGFDVLLADLMMPGLSGVELMQAALARDPELACIIMTGEGTIASAVEAMKRGALDYVLKPLKLSSLLPVIARALTVRWLRVENARLERSILERTAELEAALSEVEHQTAERLKAEQALMQAQKIEALGRLTGGVAHDFNNLLTAVIGNLELLQRKVAPEIPYRRFVDNALEAANRGAKVTAQLLAFSRTQRLRMEPVDVDAALRGSDDLLRHALGPHVELEVALCARAFANTDVVQLGLAVMNLIVNARDALPDGGVIRLRTEVDADQVVVEVADEGAGMPADVLARATEPFFTTKAGSGTGLGLAQVDAFARQCGGGCEIDSAPGAGTRVRIRLPLASAPEETPAEAPARREPTAPAHPLTVLLVDDDDQVRQTLADGLESAGFAVLAANGGPNALELLHGTRPDVAVLDYAMPVMTGAEVARRARTAHPDLPIVFCSGYADSLALDAIENAAVLRKPIAIEDLARAVRTAASSGRGTAAPGVETDG